MEKVFLIYLACLYTRAFAVKEATVCTDSSIPPVYLKCDDDERIHVVSITYRKTTEDCESLPPSQQCELTQETRRAAYSTMCEGISPQNCQVLSEKGRDTFSTSCNGRSSCWEILNDFWMIEKCGESPISVTVSYECISDYVVNMCADVTIITQNENVFLASPNFINPARSGPEHQCMCDVEGDGLNAELLELYLLQRDGQRSNLTITTDTTVWGSQDNKPLAYNDELIVQTQTLKLIFDSKQLYGQVIWIKVKGDSLRKLSCNRGSQTTLKNEITESRTTATLPRSESLIGSSDNEKSVVPLVILIILLIFIVIVLVLLIYIICRFREKHPSNYSIHRLEDSGVSYIKFDHISNAPSLPDECADNKTSYDLSSLAGTDASDIVHSASPVESHRRREDQHKQRGSSKGGRGVPHIAASNGGSRPIVEVDAGQEQHEALEEVQRLRIAPSPDPFLLQRD